MSERVPLLRFEASIWNVLRTSHPELVDEVNHNIISALGIVDEMRAAVGSRIRENIVGDFYEYPISY